MSETDKRDLVSAVERGTLVLLPNLEINPCLSRMGSTEGPCTSRDLVKHSRFWSCFLWWCGRMV